MSSRPPPSELPESIVLQGFSGLKNTVAPERLGPADLERAINIDLDDTGQPRRRRGYELKLAGDFHSVRDLGGKVYGVRNGSLGIIRPDYSFSALYSAGAGKICYGEVDRNVYFSGSGVSGVISPEEVVTPWGGTDGQGQWLSPVINPSATVGAVSGRLLGDPPYATSIEPYKGRIYLAAEKTLWATELYQYHYVERVKNFMQFEHDITLLAAMSDGLYVGTEAALYFIKGVLGTFRLSTVAEAAVLPGSGVRVPADLIHPQARNGPVPTGEAAVMMTSQGVIVGFDGGSAFNLTHDRVTFPGGVSAAALYRQDQGANSYVAAVDSAGGPSANARIGDYVDAEIIRAADS